MRLFAAVVPPPAVLDHLAAALDQVVAHRPAPRHADRTRPDRRQERDPLVPRSGWHITLAFFGEVPAGHVPELAAGLAAIASRYPPFELELAGAGTFSSRAAWIGLGGDVTRLKELMGEVADLWATGDAHGGHRPHLTFSRAVAQAGLHDAARALTVYRGPRWTVTSARLVESQLGQGEARHPRYTSVTEVALGG